MESRQHGVKRGQLCKPHTAKVAQWCSGVKGGVGTLQPVSLVRQLP